MSLTGFSLLTRGGGRTEDYVAPESTVLVWSMVAEGYPLFAPTLLHLRRNYPRDCAPLPTYMIVPPGPGYKNHPPIGRSPKCRDSSTGVEGGLMYNLIPNLGVVNNLSPNLLLLDIHPTGQAPDRRESDSLLFGLHPLLDDSDLGGGSLKI